LFLDNDLEEDDLLDGFFVAESVEMLKSKACMLCTQDFRLTLRQKNCSRCGKAICELCSNSKRRLSKISTKKYRVCDECDFMLDNCNFCRMLNREHELKLQEHEEALENLEEVKETSVQLDKELKRQ